MGISIKLLLALCMLTLFIHFRPIESRRAATTADNRAGARRARAVNNRPIPIDCKLGSWSSWTPCNACTDKKFRFHYLERPSQFGGTFCLGTLWERLACPASTEQCMVDDYCGESFTCKETGRCISQSLRCNGEPDCDDFSDEDDCAQVNQRDDKCSTLMPIPGAERGTQGYNVLTNELVDHVLDPKYFGGKCEYVYNGEWRKFIYEAVCESLHYNEEEKNYRKPYNYHTYRFVAEATSEGSAEYYEDVVGMLKARKDMSSSKGGASVGIYIVEVGMSGCSESEFIKNVTQLNGRDLGFVRLWTKVQTAHFKMRSDKLMLHEDLDLSLMELPEEYDFGMYSRFFNTFGTHYVTEGTMGGTLEYVMAINKTSMAKSNLEGSQVGSCLGASIGLNVPLKQSGATVGLSAGTNDCRKDGAFESGRDTSLVEVEDFVTLVKGGIIEKSTGLVAIRTPDTYKKWGATLKYNPSLIEYETMPIYELVRLSTAADHVGQRLANLQKAYDEYLQQFDPCRCAPCRHNGIPVLTGTSCSCLCKEGFRGEACEETLRSGARTDGQWSCWGSWSSCSSGRKTRSRDCNNPPPDGGSVCLGSSSQAQRC